VEIVKCDDMKKAQWLNRRDFFHLLPCYFQISNGDIVSLLIKKIRDICNPFTDTIVSHSGT
jgi:hypothetical protein